MITIIVLDRLHEGPAVVGAAWGLMGVCGMVAVLAFGRLDSRGRERRRLARFLVGAASAWFLIPAEPEPEPEPEPESEAEAEAEATAGAASARPAGPSD